MPDEKDQKLWGNSRSEASGPVGITDSHGSDFISLLRSVRNFLIREKETYGAFIVPEISDISDSCQADQGAGNPVAHLMLIGEATGSQEDRRGEPVAGEVDQLLDKILSAISFRRDDVYITDIPEPCFPDNRDTTPEEHNRALADLHRQIALVNPKLILCLGRNPAQILLNTRDSMNELRGRFHPLMGGREVLVTYHPAELLRKPVWKRHTWRDVQLLRERYDELTESGR